MDVVSRLLCIDEILTLLAGMEELQAKKVVDLARRLRPGLTPDDVQNPHDFPELSDPDWQFEDGQLVGIQGVVAALRQERERLRAERCR